MQSSIDTLSKRPSYTLSRVQVPLGDGAYTRGVYYRGYNLLCEARKELNFYLRPTAKCYIVEIVCHCYFKQCDEKSFK